jgi:hypothetical protein
MNWTLFAQLAVTLLVAVLGGWLGHYFSLRRDGANERRNLRISYLLEGYRKLEGGSKRQVSLAQQFATEFVRNRGASLDELIADLRQSLRSELELETVPETVVYLRIHDKP